MPPASAPAPAILAAWLALCCLLVFAMVVLGGAVRLSGSGLSMVDWRPVRGIIPPLDQAQWREAFAHYRQFPEFHRVNPAMTLAGFQFIFWMEYAHRLLGRVTGLVFLLPFLFFLARRMVPRALVGRLWLLFLLGGAQGLLGWYMVQSGLADDPDPRVSHYRLLAHFMLAAFLYAWMLRVVVGLRRRPGGDETLPPAARKIKMAGGVALAAVLIMMASGALVAGTHAGLGHNTWPKMGGLWIPEGLLALRPWWLNWVENTIAIQFAHRWLALLALLAVGGFAFRLLRAPAPAANANAAAFTAYGMLALALGQAGLGIATLTLRVPPALGVAHQAGAMLLLSVVVIALAAHLPSLAGDDRPRG